MNRVAISTPLGNVSILGDDSAVTALEWSNSAAAPTPLLLEAARQLTAYFDHRLTQFDLPMRINGSAAQQAACAAMADIPLGETRTYGDMARTLGISAQAAGQLCGGNPLPIIVPCHRILGAQSLGGFSAPGGIETKVWLLRHEGAAGLLI